MFAGPDGSGKSTLKSCVPPTLIGIYLNPDELEQQIRWQSFLDFTTYGVTTTADEVFSFFGKSEFLKSVGLGGAAQQLIFSHNRLEFGSVTVNSYLASVISDFLRLKLMEQKTSFTLETVMSHSSKIDLLIQAQAAGYRTYLYFVATDDPAINISRVKSRIKLGGHAVPEDRIETRYHRSLALLMDAIRHTNRAYVFDNSSDNPEKKHTWLAEITEGKKLELKPKQIPAWFKHAVLNKIK
jgi:predicted ABC-type ATPase